MYWGSVRFFKHLILAGIALMIVIPAGLCVFWGLRAHQLDAVNRQLVLQLKTLQAPAAAAADPSQAEAGFPLQERVWTEELPYQKLYPDLYCTPPTEPVYLEKVIYLTFDDGPSDHTEEILDILAQNDVKATFFVVGRSHDTPAGREALQRIVREGHTLGIHSYSHDYLQIYTSVESFLDDFNEMFTYIQSVTGVTPTIFRFPGGSVNTYNSGVYREIISEMTRRGFTYFDWNLAAGDAATAAVPAAQISDNILSGALGVMRGIVLLHDSSGKQTTVEALPEVIAGLRDQGFTFAALNNEVRPIHFFYRE
ncbi:polysaccharide deacetylase [Anaerofilum sp. BX8]|uniref:Polysaccharide deacetylase n=1 Tax=Anaerofilum hominis TaxID=2763016 RepID=A0A923I802_9FIRM|nr:polysaccharide deacetylase family protein [Anaerofilum hominis]MBC5581973.1 polysaccharide deacetylase [Anaerofilum hominis]